MRCRPARPRFRAATAAAAACWALALAGGGGASAAGVGPGPSVALSASEGQPGGAVGLTLTNWRARGVTVSVCGNRAARGAPDCNVTGSQGVTMERGGQPTLAVLVLSLPPVPCPCVVRAVSDSHEVAVAPIAIAGAPVGGAGGAETEAPLAVTVAAHRAPGALVASLRAALGGPTVYEVRVVVRNRSSSSLDAVALTGAARRGRTEVAGFSLAPHGPLAPGQQVEVVTRVMLPAPAVGRFVWEVTGTGAGPAVVAEAAVRRLPPALVVVVALLAGDIAALTARRLRRRRRLGRVATTPVHPFGRIHRNSHETGHVGAGYAED